MQFRERTVNGVTVIDVEGDFIVTANPGALHRAVKGALARGERQIVLNVSGILRMDSTCLSELVASYRSTLACGGALKVAAANQGVRRLLELTRLDTIIKPFATEAEAVADFLGQKGATC